MFDFIGLLGWRGSATDDVWQSSGRTDAVSCHPQADHHDRRPQRNGERQTQMFFTATPKVGWRTSAVQAMAQNRHVKALTYY